MVVRVRTLVEITHGRAWVKCASVTDKVRGDAAVRFVVNNVLHGLGVLQVHDLQVIGQRQPDGGT
jgi:hypothetical protein